MGVPAEQVLAEIARLRATDLPTHGGRLFAYVYDPAVPALDELTASRPRPAAHVNGLDPTAFPSLLAMENALVGAAAGLLGGGPARGRVGRRQRHQRRHRVADPRGQGGPRRPARHRRAANWSMPATAHAAFAKAASYLRVRLVRGAGLAGHAATVGSGRWPPRSPPDTVLVACSAPSYAHGVVDPVGAIAAVAAARGVRCHVDACFGGWALPYLRRLGAPVPPFDFSVPGVTSVSVDLHKYAYCPKGVSVLLHRDEALRAPQYFAYADWPGYTMVNPTDRLDPIGRADRGRVRDPAAPRRRRIPAAGVGDPSTRSRTSPPRVHRGRSAAAGRPATSTVVVFTSEDPALDLFVLADELTVRGWHTQPQLGLRPAAPVDPPDRDRVGAPQAAEFAPALAEAAAAARTVGPVALPADLVADGLRARPDRPDRRRSVGHAGRRTRRWRRRRRGRCPTGRRRSTPCSRRPRPAVREAIFTAFLSLLQRPTYCSSSASPSLGRAIGLRCDACHSSLRRFASAPQPGAAARGLCERRRAPELGVAARHVGGPWLHGGVTETGTRAHTGQSRTRRTPLPRYRLVRPAPARAATSPASTRSSAVVAHRAGPLLVHRRPRARARRPRSSRRSPPGSPRACAPGRHPGAHLRPAGGRGAARPDRGPHRAGRGRREPRPPRCPSPSCGPSRRTPSACSASPRPNGASRHRGC